jgi:hypothetical protein
LQQKFFFPGTVKHKSYWLGRDCIPERDILFVALKVLNIEKVKVKSKSYLTQMMNCALEEVREVLGPSLASHPTW